MDRVEPTKKGNQQTSKAKKRGVKRHNYYGLATNYRRRQEGKARIFELYH